MMTATSIFAAEWVPVLPVGLHAQKPLLRRRRQRRPVRRPHSKRDLGHILSSASFDFVD